MEQLKVLVINDEGANLDIEEAAIAEAFDGNKEAVAVKYIPATDKEAVEKELTTADGVITVYTEFDRATLDKMDRCKVIATQTIGVNTIDLDAATEKGICITNVPDYCVEEVAMHTVTLAMACSRKIVTYDKIARQKIWNVEDIYKYGQLHRLQGQTYGIVSFGNIGKRVADLVKVFGMNVMAFDPFLGEEVFEQHGVKRADSLDELFSACDIISLHTPLTPKTEGMINMDLLKKMKPEGILINTSRGGIVNEKDLYTVLKEGIITAAGVDVIIDEDTCDSALYELENVIVTPHVAYYSEEALVECRQKAAEQIGSVLGKHCLPKYLVNKNVAGATKNELK